MRNFNFVQFCLIAVVLLFSCNQTPSSMSADLESRKSQINVQLENANKKWDIKDYEGLANEYKTLKQNIIEYTAVCNSQGYPKDNDETVSEIEAKITSLEISGIAKDLKNSSYSNSSTRSTNSSSCSDENAYRLGETYAQSQRNLIADCDYLYDMALAREGQINHYCFCNGVNAWRRRNEQ